MAAFTLLDLLAFAWFLGAWLGYSLLIEKTAKGRSGLNALMNGYRDEWMEQLLGARGAHRRLAGHRRAAERHGVLRLHQPDRHRRHADAAALDRADA